MKPNPRKQDSSLVQAFQRGEAWAFSEIYSRYRKSLLGYISQRVFDRESCEDLAQEVFVKVYRAREAYQPEYAFSTWLWAIARNSVTDWLSKSGRGMILPESSLPEGNPALDEFPTTQPSAEVVFENRSKRKALLHWVKKLSSLQRKVFWMRIIHQLSYEEIARKLDLSLSSVKCAMYRAKLALAEQAPQGLFHESIAELS